jgi:hypothetical protein
MYSTKHIACDILGQLYACLIISCKRFLKKRSDEKMKKTIKKKAQIPFTTCNLVASFERIWTQ